MSANVKKAVELMGREPLNPIGACFDSSAFQAFAMRSVPSMRLCHGIGVSNMPGQEGATMKHAWVEYMSAHGQLIAIDTTWGLREPAIKYRAAMRLSFVIEYRFKDLMELWALHDMPGPWHPRILEIADRKTEGEKSGRT